MLEEFMMSRYGGYTIMLGLFGVIVLLLRLLFGPRGWLRDPAWDRRNEEIRAEEQKAKNERLRRWQRENGEEVFNDTDASKAPGSASGKEAYGLTTDYATLIPEDLAPWLDAHCRKFLAYALPFTEGKDDGPLRLKVEHSLLVFQFVRRLVREEPLRGKTNADDLMNRAAQLAALYHDCGRFSQFRQYGTFLDAASTNHARLGLRVIREQRFFADDPGLEPAVSRLARTAVLLHNRYSLPERMDPDAALITYAVRDGDKLDILRVMAAHLNNAFPDKDAVLLNVRNEPDKYSPAILQQVFDREIPRYADLRYVNDFRLLLGTWPDEFRFATTRKTLAASGLMEEVLRDLPDIAPMREARELILDRLVHPREKNA